jgi:glycosyltransferase involved in cell wall biosynthesis
MKMGLAARWNYGVTRRIVTDYRPEVAYVWGLRHVSISPALAAIDSGIPCVFRLEDYWLSGIKNDLFLAESRVKKAFRRALVGLWDFRSIERNPMLGVSHALMKAHLDKGFPERNMAVVPEAIADDLCLDQGDLEEKPFNRGKLRMVYVGRIDESKGVHVAIETVKELTLRNRKMDVCLDVVGVGPKDYMQRLRSLATSLTLGDKVRFLGFMEHEEVKARLPGYDVLLFPSLWVEPFGIVVVEAMAKGVVVVATNRGGPAEIITDGVSGLLVEPGTASGMAEAVLGLAEDRAQASRIRMAALERIRREYSQSRKMDRIEGYLRSAVADASSGRPRWVEADASPMSS